MSRTRIALLGGPVFFVSWFVGAQVLWFASGGVANDESAPNAAEYPEAVLSNQSGVNSGSTLRVLAAISLCGRGRDRAQLRDRRWHRDRHRGWSRDRCGASSSEQAGELTQPAHNGTYRRLSPVRKRRSSVLM